MFSSFVNFVRDLYQSADFIPLHEPRFSGNEKKYLIDTIDSTFVSSVGAYVDEFEQRVAQFTGSQYAIATVNGTAALHISLLMAGVEKGDEVITQSLTFAATCAAIRYCHADPVFVDVEKKTLGMSPESLFEFLSEYTERDTKGILRNCKTGRKIKACVPMHTFGHPARIDEIDRICNEYNIILIEDAAESLGSTYKNIHTGCFGKMSVLSFNGNKIITTGGGGMILTDDLDIAKQAKHLTTTAKKTHPWLYEHDAVGYNYRLPNLNAALGCAQMEQLESFLEKKRVLADRYSDWCSAEGLSFIQEPIEACSNYWLNALLLDDQDHRNRFLVHTNDNKVMTRPAWVPMHRLSMYNNCFKLDLQYTEWLADRLVNIPSSVILDER